VELRLVLLEGVDVVAAGVDDRAGGIRRSRTDSRRAPTTRAGSRSCRQPAPTQWVERRSDAVGDPGRLSEVGRDLERIGQEWERRLARIKALAEE
jgi:hypothetical protein